MQIHNLSAVNRSTTHFQNSSQYYNPQVQCIPPPLPPPNQENVSKRQICVKVSKPKIIVVGVNLDWSTLYTTKSQCLPGGLECKRLALLKAVQQIQSKEHITIIHCFAISALNALGQIIERQNHKLNPKPDLNTVMSAMEQNYKLDK